MSNTHYERYHFNELKHSERRPYQSIIRDSFHYELVVIYKLLTQFVLLKVHTTIHEKHENNRIDTNNQTYYMTDCFINHQ
jgi:hypothetical protein